MKKYVKIASTMDLRMTPDFRSIDTTNYGSPNADRLSIKPAWTGLAIIIKQGIGYYPAQIKDWFLIKSYGENGILTIGDETDTLPSNITNVDEINEMCNKLSHAEKKYQDDIKYNEEVKLKTKKAKAQQDKYE